jgi:3-hydroxyacyl-CoA dehydrogenase/enoyl-CoA hydratase/3-hydroxybutyryl-CoA epimerase/enoyl-CoA isomerase
MGPAQLLDVIGLDVINHSGEVLAKGYADRMAARPGSAVAALHRAGRLGRKSGAGFYRYRPDSRGKLRPESDDTVYELIERRSGPAGSLAADELVHRMMRPLRDEAQRCIDEGIVDCPDAVDLAMIYGAAFPAVRGGPLALAGHDARSGSGA